MVEVHPDPDRALSDAEQQLTFDQFRSMMAQLVPVHEQVRGLRSAPIASEPAGVGGGSGLGRHR
jgi:3-deoxy-D-manno-octulosonic acid (KDO) 8-phosphate synthase